MPRRSKGWFGVLLLTLVLTSQLVSACFSPADLYAVEVVLDKPGVTYDLSRLSNLTVVKYSGKEAYAYKSRYDPRLIVILSEQELFDGRYLSLRLQVPVRDEKVTFYKYKLPGTRCGMELHVGEIVKVEAGSGETSLDLGVLRFNSTAFITFKPVLVLKEKSINLTVNGLLKLNATAPATRAGSSKSYTISMPCLLSINSACYRVMTLIPGYDAPLRIDEGAYRASLTLNWHSSGEASVLVEKLQIVCEHVVQPQPLLQQGWVEKDKVVERVVGDAKITLDTVEGVITIESRQGTLPDEVKVEVERLLASLGLADTEPTWEVITETQVEPSLNVSTSEIRTVLKGELAWLVSNGIVKGLSYEDIEAIVSSARLGYAGWNNRLVWSGKEWVPYTSIPGAKPVRCSASSAEVFTPIGNASGELKTAGVVGEKALEAKGTGFPPVPSLMLFLAISVSVALVAALTAYFIVKKLFMR